MELVAGYLRHTAGYYEPGAELNAIKSAMKIVRQHYGADAAAIREAFVGKA